MKKSKLNKKLSLKKVSIANLEEVKGGAYAKGSEVDPYTCSTIIIDECFKTLKICVPTYFNCPTNNNLC